MVKLNYGKLVDLLKNRELDKSDPNQGFLIKSVYYILVGYVQTQSAQLTGRFITYKQLRGARFGDFSNIGAREKLFTKISRGYKGFGEAVRLLEGSETNFP